MKGLPLVLISITSVVAGAWYGNVVAVSSGYISIRNPDASLPILILGTVIATGYALGASLLIKKHARHLIAWFAVASAASCLVSLSAWESEWYWDTPGTVIAIQADSGKGATWQGSVQLLVNGSGDLEISSDQRLGVATRWEIGTTRDVRPSTLGSGCRQVEGHRLTIECSGSANGLVAVIPKAVRQMILGGGRVALAVQLEETDTTPTDGVTVVYKTWDFLGKNSLWRVGSVLSGAGTMDYASVRFAHAQAPQTIAIELRNPQGLVMLSMIQQVCLIILGGSVTLSLLGTRSRSEER